MIRRTLGLLLGAVVVGAPAACSSYDPPRLTVSGARIAEQSDAGMVIEFTLNAENTNSVAIPLREMRYSLSLDGSEVFRGFRSPEATLRRYGLQQLRIPAVIPLKPGEPAPSGAMPYRIDGTLTYIAPGELGELLFENDVKRPTVAFTQKGTIDFDAATPTPAPAPVTPSAPLPPSTPLPPKTP